jgi:hypothetical protein
MILYIMYNVVVVVFFGVPFLESLITQQWNTINIYFLQIFVS